MLQPRFQQVPKALPANDKGMPARRDARQERMRRIGASVGLYIISGLYACGPIPIPRKLPIMRSEVPLLLTPAVGRQICGR